MTLEPLHGPFYIWHSPGGTWSDNGGQHYGAATHKVVDLRRSEKHSGATGMTEGRGLPEVSGRLSKAVRDEWLAWVIKQS